MSVDLPSAITVTQLRVGQLAAVELPIHLYLVDHPEARILVDTGLTCETPEAADLAPSLVPVAEWGLDLDSVTAVVNTHLHFDHCGGNWMFPGRPIYVQQRELADARTQADYTIPEWVDPPGVSLDYRPLRGPMEIIPGVRLLPAPGHTPGSQIVEVATEAGTVVIVGDTAVWSGQLDQPETPGQRLVRSLDPVQVWLAHQTEPWRPADLN